MASTQSYQAQTAWPPAAMPRAFGSRVVRLVPAALASATIHPIVELLAFVLTVEDAVRPKVYSGAIQTHERFQKTTRFLKRRDCPEKAECLHKGGTPLKIGQTGQTLDSLHFCTSV